MNVAILLSELLWKCEIGIEKWDLTLKFHVATWLATDWHARAQVCRIYEQSLAASRKAKIKSFAVYLLIQDDLYNKSSHRTAVAGCYMRYRGGPVQFYWESVRTIGLRPLY